MPLLLIILLLAAPTISGLLQLALARTRELDADLEAARLTGDPRGLASALAKPERLQGGLWTRILLPERGNPELSLLRSHPTTDERIRRLLELERRPPERRPPERRPPERRPPPLRPADQPQLPIFHAIGLPLVPVSRPRFRLSGLWR